MRKYSLFCLLMSLGLTLLLAGCGGEEEKKPVSEKVIGMWKRAEAVNEWHDFVEINKDSYILNEGSPLAIALVDKDGKVELKKADGDEVLAVITFVNDKVIEMTLSGQEDKVRFERSTKEELIKAKADRELLLDMRDNERGALATLRGIGMAQISFHLSGFSAVAGNNAAITPRSFCDNFRNLYYGSMARSAGRIALISKETADAFAYQPENAALREGAAKEAAPFHGYLFATDDTVADAAKKFGAVAYPIQYKKTGTVIFYVDQTGGIYFMNPETRDGVKEGEMPAKLKAEETPANAPDLWKKM